MDEDDRLTDTVVLEIDLDILTVSWPTVMVDMDWTFLFGWGRSRALLAEDAEMGAADGLLVAPTR